MIIPKIARYDYCCAKANEFLINENITTFPFDSDEIIKKHKWSKLKYSDLAKRHNVNVSDIIEAYDSEDGYSIYNGRNYTIAYNDTISTKQRIYFTKLHEIGHIYLGHFIDFEQTILNRSGMTEKEYKVLEKEANCFARNVLVPITLMDELSIKCPARISLDFGITPPASKARFDLSKNDLYHFSQIQLQSQRKLLHNFIHKKECLQCGYGFISKTAKYCPICGHNRLTRGDGKLKYNDGYQLDERGKAKICPKCENEEIYGMGKHCKICGTDLINRCISDSCSEIAEGNARYCVLCGAPTTFSTQQLFEDWEFVKKQQEDDSFENIPW